MQAIILPGLDGSAELREPFASALPFPAKTISYPIDEELSYQALSHFVSTKLPRKDDYVLIAESFSGPIAARLGARKLPHMKAIVFVASFVKRPIPVPAELVSLLDQAPLHSDLLFRFARPLTFGRWGDAEIEEHLLSQIRSLPESLIRYRLSQILSVNAMEKFRSIRLPMLYLRPKQDRVVWKTVGMEMADVNPHLRVETVKGPHFALLAQPQTCAESIADFVSTHVTQATHSA